MTAKRFGDLRLRLLRRFLLVSCFVLAGAVLSTAGGAEKDARITGLLRELFAVKLLPSHALEEPFDGSQLLGDEVADVEETRRQFKRMKKFAAEAVLSNAFLIGEDLARSDGDLFYPVGGGQLVPVRNLVYRYIDEVIPESVKKEQSEKRGLDQLYERAKKEPQVERRLALLREVIDGFLYSEEVVPAVVSLVDLCAANGRYNEALSVWSDLLQVNHSFKLEQPDVLLKLAVCLNALGRNERAVVVVSVTARLFPNYPMTVGGKPRKLSDVAAELIKQFETAEPARPLQNWPTYGGDMARAAAPVRQIDEVVLSWRAPTPAVRDMTGRRLVLPKHAKYSLPVAFPLTVDGVVYTRSVGTVEARNWVTGRLTWSYTHRRDYQGDSAEPYHFRTFDAEDVWPLAVGKGWLVWAPRAGKWSGHTWPELVGMKAVPGQTEPKVVWVRGGISDPDAVLQKAYFCGGITVAGDRIYTIVVSPGDKQYVLCGFSASTGRLIWRTPVGSLRGHERWRMTMELGGLAPVADESTVYCTAGDGVVHAVDAITGRRRWAFRSPAGVRPKTAHQQHLPVRQDSPVLRGGRLFLLVPYADKKRLIALNARTGRLESNLPVNSDAFVIGVLGSRVYVCEMGDKRIRCIDTAGGGEAWKTQLDRQLLYRPLLLREQIWCPVPEGLQLIDTHWGTKIGGKVPTFRWGELSCRMRVAIPGAPPQIRLAPSGSKFLLATDREVVALYSASFAKEAAAKLAQNPNDPFAQFDLAQWKHLRGDFDAASDVYKKVLELAREPGAAVPEQVVMAVRARMSEILEVQATGKLGQGEIAAAQALLREAISLCVDSTRRVQMTYRLAALLAKSGDAAGSAEQWIRLLTVPADVFVTIGPGLRVNANILAARRIAELTERNVLPQVTSRPALFNRVTSVMGLLRAGGAVGPQETEWEFEKAELAPAFTMSRFLALPGGRFAMLRNGRIEVRNASSGRIVWQYGSAGFNVGLAFDPQKGVYVSEVTREQARGQALQKGDRIRLLEGKPVTSLNDLALAFAKKKPGEPMAIRIIRRGMGATGALSLQGLSDNVPEWLWPERLFDVRGGALLLVQRPQNVLQLFDTATGEFKAAYAIGPGNVKIHDKIVCGNRLVAIWTARPQPGFHFTVYDVHTGKRLWTVHRPRFTAPQRFKLAGQRVLIRSGFDLAVIDVRAPNADQGLQLANVGNKSHYRGNNVVSPDHFAYRWHQNGWHTDCWNVWPPKVAWSKRKIGYFVGGSGSIVLATDNRKITALNAKDGAVLWQHPGNTQPHAVEFGKDVVWMYGRIGGNHTIEAFDAKSGKILWSRRVNNADNIKEANGILFAESKDRFDIYPRRLYWLDAKTGEVLGTTGLTGSARRPGLPNDSHSPDVFPVGSGFLVVTGDWIRGYVPKVEWPSPEEGE